MYERLSHRDLSAYQRFPKNFLQFLHILLLMPSTYILNYSLTPRSRVLLEKLTGFQLVKNSPAFYGTKRFITTFTSARHLSLSRACSIQSKPPHPTSWRSILILSSHLRLLYLLLTTQKDFIYLLLHNPFKFSWSLIIHFCI